MATIEPGQWTASLFIPYAELAANGILALAALWGAFVAWKGLRAWRDQLTGRTEYDLSRRLLLTTYRVRGEIGRVRSPLMTAAEIASAAKDAGLDVATVKAAGDPAIAAVRDSRWRQLSQELSALEVDELEAEVLWGKEARTTFAPLHKCTAQLHRATVEYLMLGGDTDTPQHADERRLVKLRSIMHGPGDSGDEFAGDVQSAINGIEDYLRPRLR